MQQIITKENEKISTTIFDQKLKTSLATYYENNVYLSSKDTIDYPIILSMKSPISDNIPRIKLICTLDIRGSMEGLKIGLLRQTMIRIIDFLSVGDYIGIIIFSSVASVLINMTEIKSNSDKEKIKERITFLDASGCTNILDATLKSAEMYCETYDEKYFTSVLFLSDGDETINKLNISDLITQELNNFAINNIKLSDIPFYTFSLGVEINDVSILELLSNSKGKYSMIQNIEDIVSTFATFLGSLKTIYTERVEFWIELFKPDKLNDVCFGKTSSIITDFEQNDKIIKKGITNLFASDIRKDFIFYLQIPPIKTTINDFSFDTINVKV